jgi:hypothetical protein
MPLRPAPKIRYDKSGTPEWKLYVGDRLDDEQGKVFLGSFPDHAAVLAAVFAAEELRPGQFDLCLDISLLTQDLVEGVSSAG